MTKNREEWIKCCLEKHGPKGDGTMTREQCIAAAYDKFGKRNKRPPPKRGRYRNRRDFKDIERIVVKFKEIMRNEPQKNKREALKEAYYYNGEPHRRDFISDCIIFDFIGNINDFTRFYPVYKIVYDDLSPAEKREIDEIKLSIKKAEGKGSPSLVKGGSGKKVRGKISFKDRPLSPVTSSVIAGRGVLKNKLYVRFHKKPHKTYKYEFSSNEEALEAFDDMVKESPGGWFWDNIRGKKLGPVYGNPSKYTPGGTTASKVPYEPVSSGRVERFLKKVPKFEEIAKNLRAYKMSVKEVPTSREPFTIKELKEAQELGIYPPKIDFKCVGKLKLDVFNEEMRYSWFYNPEKEEYEVVDLNIDDIEAIIYEISEEKGKFVLYLEGEKIKSFDTMKDLEGYLNDDI